MATRFERLWNLRSGPWRETIRATMPPDMWATMFFLSTRTRAEHGPWVPLQRLRGWRHFDELYNFGPTPYDASYLAGPVLWSIVDPEVLAQTAAFHNHRGAMRWAESRGAGLDARALYAAVMGGHVDMIGNILARSDRLYMDSTACRHAAARGHVHVLRWIRNRDPSGTLPDSVWSAAAFGGHVHVLQWLRAQHVPFKPFTPMVEGAIQGGHVYVLDWLWENIGRDAIEWSASLTETMMLRNGDSTDILQWWHEHDLPWSSMTDLYALYGDNVKGVEFMLARGRDVRGAMFSFVDERETPNLNEWLKTHRDLVPDGGDSDLDDWDDLARNE